MNSKLETPNGISDEMFRYKQESSQTSYLNFSLSNTSYAINIQNVINIIDNPNLVYLSHISPPIIGMQFYNSQFIPVLDFAGYRPYSKKTKLLVLSSSAFRKNHPFGLLIDQIEDLKYFKSKDLRQNPYPFNNLLPSYYFSKYKKREIFFLDIQDLENQID